MAQICTRCVMDTTDPDIRFDAQGVCHHCHNYDAMARNWDARNAAADLEKIVERIGRAGKGKPYDCIIGVSGGVDSTFVAYKVKQLGLRPLAVHLDNGWDSELAVKNIETVLRKLGIDLFTHVIDWEEFRDLQLAFLKASTPDSEIPTDHAIVALMYQMARKTGVPYVVAGYNFRTESHLPPAWSQGHFDWRYIRDVHRRFGTVKLRTFPYRRFISVVLDRWRIRQIDILNYMPYSKSDAMQFLQRELGWRYYGGKHYESIYTRFYQGYILPRKFGFDKRKTHLSSLVCSKEITREQALEELRKEPYDPELQAQDREYAIKKLGLSEAEFEAIMRAPRKRYQDYANTLAWMKFLSRLKQFLRKLHWSNT